MGADAMTLTARPRAIQGELGLPPGADLAEGSGRHVRELVLTLRVSDPDVVAELSRREAGDAREEYASAALRVGVLALRTAGGTLDADAVRDAGARLMGELRETLAARAAELTGEMSRSLTQYFDPRSGVLSQKIDHLVRDGGELERLLRAHVGDESLLARTLVSHVGQGSALFKMLSPEEAEGLKAQVETALTGALKTQSDEVLRQFSLDHRDSALSRLVGEIRTHQDKLGVEMKGQVDAMVREFSLDKPDSALSRLSVLLRQTHEQIGKNLTLDDEQSALARLRRELMGTIDGLVEHNVKFHTDVRAALAALEARKEEAGRSTRHGLAFEDALGGLLAAEAQRVGDVHRATGATTGAIKLSKVGDHVIGMGPDSSAPGAQLVFEAKEDKSVDLRSALDEIERARKNRSAQIGVFVFSARTAPDGLQPLARYGDDIVCVWDAEDDRTDLHVRCAYTLARALASRVAQSTQQSEESLSAIERAVRAVEKQLAHLADVERMASTVKTHGEKIELRMKSMRTDLTREVERIDEQVTALRASE
ncbi:MAG TPA: hypothetical protein VMZ28_19550 [Kofleriaceae bacterium]|nr:hypothetical protein [Kofleriaceae bacterium]